MKNIQKYLSALLALAMAAPVFTGCSDDYEYSLSSVVAKPSDKFNARIQFVSRLSDGALITGDADYTALNNYMVNTLKSREEAWLTVFDRSDNANLDKARRLLWPIKQKYGSKISWAGTIPAPVDRCLATRQRLGSSRRSAFGWLFVVRMSG